MFASKSLLSAHVVAALAYDATGVGAKGNGTTYSYNITAAAGADIFTWLVTDRQVTPSNIKCAGVSMALVDSQVCNNTVASTNGTLYLYRSAGAGTGSAVAMTGSIPSSWWVTNSVSYTGVTSVGAAHKTYGSSGPGSTGSISCSAGQLIIAAIGGDYDGTTGSISSPSGGTNRYINYNATTTNSGLSISDSTSTATFTATVGIGWSAMAFVLS